jgi:hypothetical protein
VGRRFNTIGICVQPVKTGLSSQKLPASGHILPLAGVRYGLRLLDLNYGLISAAELRQKPSKRGRNWASISRSPNPSWIRSSSVPDKSLQPTPMLHRTAPTLQYTIAIVQGWIDISAPSLAGLLSQTFTTRSCREYRRFFNFPYPCKRGAFHVHVSNRSSSPPGVQYLCAEGNVCLLPPNNLASGRSKIRTGTDGS